MVMVDDYHFDGTFPSIEAGDSFDCVTGVVAYSYGEFKIYPRNTDDFSCSGCVSNGDVNADMNVDVLDVVSIVAYVLGNSVFDSNELKTLWNRFLSQDHKYANIEQKIWTILSFELWCEEYGVSM